MPETISPYGSYSPEHRPENEEIEEREEEGYRPADVEPGYRPSYSPDEIPETPPYAPYAPETAETEDFQARAIEAIKGVVDRANERAQDRYGHGRMGRLRGFFRREGRRDETETLDQIGEWQKNAKWKKWALMGGKAAGGVGVATAMVATGGVGAVLTPLIWSAGAREAWDGTLEAVEELGWGRKRSQVELAAQAVLNQRILTLKTEVRGTGMNEERFQQLLCEMLDAENGVIEAETKNVRGEKKGKLIRSIASTVLTIGTGLMAGVPLGTHDYDKAATRVGNVFLDESHRVMWNLHGGGQFLYNQGEFGRVAAEAAKHSYTLTTHGTSGIDLYRQVGHVLGHGLPVAEKMGLVGAGLYQLGRNIIDFLPGRGGRRREEQPYAPYSSSSRSPYSSNQPYSPGSYGPGFYGPDSANPDMDYNIPTSSEDEIRNERATLESYLSNLGPEASTELAELGRNLPAMNEKCEYAVCIPASYAEHRVIYHTLEQYLNQQGLDGQPLDPQNFEVNVYVNGPEDKKADIDQTVAEIERFKQDHPEIVVNAISKTFPDKANIGKLRKDLNDLTLLRSINRSQVENPLYLVSNDADVEKIDPQYFAKAGRVFQTHPEIKMFAGKEDYREEEYQKYPYLLASRRLWQFADIVMRHRQYSDFLPKTLGLNSFIRSESYAKAGGYNPESWVAEDLHLARDIANKEGSQAISYKNVSVNTSARRDMAMIEKGVPIVQAYEGFGNREMFREQKAKPVSLEQLTLDNPEFVKRLNKEATAVFDDLYKRFFWSAFDRNAEVRKRRNEQGRSADTKDLVVALRKDPRYGGEAARKAGKAFRKTMGFWGADYELLESQHGDFKVKITNWEKLKAGLVA